jgi:predicted sugar kinase
MRDWKYLNLIVGRAQLIATKAELAAARSRHLRRVANAFSDSIGRITALSVGLGEVAHAIRRDQWSVDFATFKAKGIVREPFAVFKPSEAVRKEFGRQMEIINAIPEFRRRPTG